MKRMIKAAFAALAFSFLIAGSADFALAQKKGGNWKADKEARKEYRQDMKEARKEYRRDVRDARKEYKQYRKSNGYYGTDRQRGYGYYNVRPYRGARRAHVKGRLPQNRIGRYYRRFR